jgi:phosphoglycerate dehydrogenase-like enzyme
MNRETLLVLGRPSESLLARLEAAAADLEIVVGETADDFLAAAPQATVALCWSSSKDLLREVLLKSPQLRWVHIMSAGINHLLSPELLESRAVVTNGRGIFSDTLGEWVVGAILYFAKDFRRLIRSQSEGRWDPFDIVEVSGQTVGIVGYGDIGRAVATRVRPLGMRVLGLTRRGPRRSGGGLPGGVLPAGGAPDAAASLQREDDLVERIFGPADLIPMIELSDYIVVTAPLTPETRGMIGEAEFAAMKPDAVLINIGRGPIVAEEPLVRALTEKRIKGAALDVFHREPLPGDHPLYRLDNVLLSPHSADHTPDWLEKAMELFLENLQRYRRGEALVNVLDKGSGY